MSRAEKVLKPTRPFLLGTDLRTSQKVAFRNDADELARCIEHGQPAHMIFEHLVRGLEKGRLGQHGEGVTSHDLVRAHDDLLR
jgi:hypothetical protein